MRLLFTHVSASAYDVVFEEREGGGGEVSGAEASEEGIVGVAAPDGEEASRGEGLVGGGEASGGVEASVAAVGGPAGAVVDVEEDGVEARAVGVEDIALEEGDTGVIEGTLLEVRELAAGEGDDGGGFLRDQDLLDPGDRQDPPEGGAEAEAADQDGASAGGEGAEGELGAEGGAGEEDDAVEDDIDALVLFAERHALAIDGHGAYFHGQEATTGGTRPQRAWGPGIFW
jgi:hypothetical protein